MTERTSSMLDEVALKTEHKDKGRSKTLSEVKPVENISKNLQSFLVMSSVQKEVFPSHKIQDHIYK